MAWGKVLAIEPTDCPTDCGLWCSFLFMHQTHVPLPVAMSVNLVTRICCWRRDDAMPNETSCFQRTLQTFFFLSLVMVVLLLLRHRMIGCMCGCVTACMCARVLLVT